MCLLERFSFLLSRTVARWAHGSVPFALEFTAYGRKKFSLFGARQVPIFCKWRSGSVKTRLSSATFFAVVGIAPIFFPYSDATVKSLISNHSICRRQTCQHRFERFEDSEIPEYRRHIARDIRSGAGEYYFQNKP